MRAHITDKISEKVYQTTCEYRETCPMSRKCKKNESDKECFLKLGDKLNRKSNVRKTKYTGNKMIQDAFLAVLDDTDKGSKTND